MDLAMMLYDGCFNGRSYVSARMPSMGCRLRRSMSFSDHNNYVS